MANGPRAHNMQFLETVDFLVGARLGELEQLPLRHLRGADAAVRPRNRPASQGASMPIYEYRCRACAHAFEALVRGGTRRPVPAARATDLERLVSLFAVDSDGTRQTARDRVDGQERQAPAGQGRRRRRALQAAPPLTTGPRLPPHDAHQRAGAPVRPGRRSAACRIRDAATTIR